jgi:hypothetical protein
MCIIVEKKAEHKVTRENIDNWHQLNRDGWGIVFLDDSGQPVALRGMKKKALIRALPEIEGRAAYIHLRMGTAGARDLANTHPFEVIPGVFFIHNGHISIARNADAKRSDTWHFAELVLKPLLAQSLDPHALLRDPALHFLITQTVGQSNKLVFFDKFGGVVLNEKSWYTHTDGMRYSNLYAWNPGTAKTTGESKYKYSPEISEILDGWEDEREYETPDHIFDGLPDELLDWTPDEITEFVFRDPTGAADTLDFFGHSDAEHGTGYPAMLSLVTDNPEKAARALVTERDTFTALYNPMYHD